MGGTMNDAVVNFGAEEEPKGLFKHPIAVVFHMTFRILAIVTYLFCEWFSGSFIISFLFIILFLSLDFWTVKNVTGRLLAGLRWWNVVDDEGNSRWKFESRKDDSKTNRHESRIFWLALVVVPSFWAVFVFVTFFTLKWRWLLVNLLALGMTGANMYGYLRCRWSSRQEISTYISQTFLKSVISGGSSKPATNPERS